MAQQLSVAEVTCSDINVTNPERQTSGVDTGDAKSQKDLLRQVGHFVLSLLRRHPKTRLITREVSFEGFKASPKPSGPTPHCYVCDRPLIWKPDRYRFTEGDTTFVVPEIGWYKCPSGHPGEIFPPDLQRYAQLTKQHRSIHTTPTAAL